MLGSFGQGRIGREPAAAIVVALIVGLALAVGTFQRTRPEALPSTAFERDASRDALDGELQRARGTTDRAELAHQATAASSDLFARVQAVWAELRGTFDSTAAGDRMAEAATRAAILEQHAPLFEQWAASPAFPAQVVRLYEFEARESVPLPDLARVVFQLWLACDACDSPELAVRQAVDTYLDGYEPLGRAPAIAASSASTASAGEPDSTTGLFGDVPYYGELADVLVALGDRLSLPPAQAIEEYWPFLTGAGLAEHELVHRDTEPRAPWPHKRSDAVVTFGRLGRPFAAELFSKAMLDPELRVENAASSARSIAFGALELWDVLGRPDASATGSAAPPSGEQNALELGAILRKRMFVGIRDPEIRRSLYFATYEYVEGEQFLREVMLGIEDDHEGGRIAIPLGDRAAAIRVLGARRLIAWHDLEGLSQDREPRIARAALATMAGFLMKGVLVRDMPQRFSDERLRTSGLARQAMESVASDENEDTWKRVIGMQALSGSFDQAAHAEFYRSFLADDNDVIAVIAAIGLAGGSATVPIEEIASAFSDSSDGGARLVLAREYFQRSFGRELAVADREIAHAVASGDADQLASWQEQRQGVLVRAGDYLASLSAAGLSAHVRTGDSPSITPDPDHLPESLRRLEAILSELRADGIELEGLPPGTSSTRIFAGLFPVLVH